MGESKRRKTLELGYKLPKRSEGWIGFTKKEMSEKFGNDYMDILIDDDGMIELQVIGDIIYVRLKEELKDKLIKSINNLQQMNLKDIKWSNIEVPSMDPIYLE
jgi:hypothetical protein